MKTVNRKLLDSWYMLDGGENIHPVVVDGDRLKKWSGTEWQDRGAASDADKTQFPHVVEE